MKRLLISFLFILVISVHLTSAVNCTEIDNLDSSNLKEIASSIKQPIYDEIQQEYLKNIDVVSIAKLAIQNYYNKKTFEEPEWIRVKNFLTWMDKNKNSLNEDFYIYLLSYRSFNLFYKFSYLEKQVFIGSFLGANYLTRNVIGKKFELQILLRGRCRVYEYGGICIHAFDIISAINGAVHEATHMLPVNSKSYLGKEITKSDILSEQAAITSQLKYGLPLRINEDNILSGTRSNFRIADKEFITRYLTPLFMREYAESALAVTEYSEYINKVPSIAKLKYNTDISVDSFLSKLLYYKALAKYVEERKLSDSESKLLTSKVYKDTLNEVYASIYASSIDKLEVKSIERIDLKSFELFEDNKISIATIFFKNLKKYADPNIPPVPKGYI